MASKKTVRIKFNTSIGGNALDERGQSRGQFVYLPGQEVDWEEKEAAVFVERGYATYVTQQQAK